MFSHAQTVVLCVSCSMVLCQPTGGRARLTEGMQCFCVHIITWPVCVLSYRKIPKISPGAYIFQRPFLRGLFLEGLIYGGKFAFQNQLGYPYSWNQIYCFFSVLLCIWRQFSKYKPPGGLYSEGQFNGGFLVWLVWGAYTWTGLFSKFYGICSTCRAFSNNMELQIPKLRNCMQ